MKRDLHASGVRRGGRWMAAVVALLLALVALPARAAAPAEGVAAADSLAADAAVCFLNMPADVLDVLPVSSRFKMVTYWEADSVYHAPNAMEGTSWLREVTPDFLDVQITDVSRMQIRLLPLRGKKEKIVMTVYTVGSDTHSPDSDIRFFSAEMKELPRDRYFKEPRLKDFFSLPKDSPLSMKEIEEKIPFPTVEYSASAADTSLTGRLTVGTYMNEDDYKEVKPYEKSGIAWDWDGKRFRLRK